jgi:hypothetical protein
MIGIPEAFAAAETPGDDGAGACRASQLFEMAEFGDAIEAASSANAAIPFEHAFTEMTGIGAELPFFDAPIGAECEPARRNFEAAPAAEAAAVGTFGKRIAIGSPAGHGTHGAHENRIQGKCFDGRSLTVAVLKRLGGVV